MLRWVTACYQSRRTPRLGGRVRYRQWPDGRQHGGTPEVVEVEGAHGAIIDDATWTAAESIARRRLRAPRPDRPPRLLTTLCRCALRPHDDAPPAALDRPWRRRARDALAEVRDLPARGAVPPEPPSRARRRTLRSQARRQRPHGSRGGAGPPRPTQWPRRRALVGDARASPTSRRASRASSIWRWSAR